MNAFLFLALCFHYCAAYLSHKSFNERRHIVSRFKNKNCIEKKSREMFLQNENDNLYGAEFETDISKNEKYYNPYDVKYWKGKMFDYIPTSKSKEQVMEGYYNLRKSFFSDSLLISAIGFSVTWMVGSYTDAVSFASGAILGLGYSVLLSKYVEKIGTGSSSRFSDIIRLIPVIILIALYGKYKTLFNIFPLLIGFFASFQLASLMQVFNQNAYGEKDR